MQRSIKFLVLIWCCSLNNFCYSQNNHLRPGNIVLEWPEYKEVKTLLDTRQFKEAEPQLETIISKLANEGRTKDLIEIKLLLAKSIMHQWRTDEALKVYHSCYNLAKSNQYNQLQSDCIMALNTIYQFKQRYDKVEKLTKEGLKLTDIEEDDYSNYCMEYAHLKALNNQKDSAFHFIKIAYDIDVKLKDTVSMIKTCNIMGLIHQHFEEYDKALEKHLEGKSYIAKDNYVKQAFFHLNIAEVLISANNLDRAKKYILQSIEHANNYDLTSSKAKLYASLGDVESKKENYDLALKHYNTSDSINTKSKNKKTKLVNMVGRISAKLFANKVVPKSEIDQLISMRTENIDNFLKHKVDLVHLHYLSTQGVSKTQFYDKFNEYKNTNTYLDDDLLNRNLAQIEYFFLKDKGEYKKANEKLEEYLRLKKLLEKEKQNYIVQDLEAQYNQKVQSEQIASLGDLTEVQKFKLQQQKTFLKAGGLLLFAFLTMLFFIFRLYKKVYAQNETISTALKDKDILLREIHHRVKNNLQVISSLLSLQSRQIEDDNIKKVIKEGRSRVRSMALIHQNLYMQESLTGVSISEYLKKLVEELFNSYNVNQDKITLDLDIDDIHLDVDTMVPFGLILNELISNCLKHAFPDNREGIIGIKVKEKNNSLLLTIQDNGIGVDHDTLIQSNSFGNRLIKAFSNKLGADLLVEKNNGTIINLMIRNFKKAS